MDKIRIVNKIPLPGARGFLKIKNLQKGAFLEIFEPKYGQNNSKTIPYSI